MKIAYLGPASKISTELRLRPIEYSLDALPNVDVIISYRYRHLIPKQCLDAFSGRIINIHTSMLPWQRGAHPIFWGFIEGSQLGVTIHEIDAGMDTGPIIAQIPVYVDPKTATFKTAWHHINANAVHFFLALWPNLLDIMPQEQAQGGTKHFVSDLAEFIWDHNVSYFMGI